MFVSKVRNAEDGWIKGIAQMKEAQRSGDADVASPRGKRVIVYPSPFATIYTQPRECVVFDAVRDANPFFHFIEGLWVLAGREDVASLTQYNARMVDFSDDGKIFHAPYGHRLRVAQGIDQLKEVLALLKREPDTRRAVLQIWDAKSDLNYDCKDIPCNDLIFLSLKYETELSMTVCCRSNDMIWGCYGSNVVQFSLLLQYLADMGGYRVGTYTQISNNFHVYPDNPVWGKVLNRPTAPTNPYSAGIEPYYPFVSNPATMDEDLYYFFEAPDARYGFSNKVFEDIAIPMRDAYAMYRAGDLELALRRCRDIKAEDWELACSRWIERRIIRRRIKENDYDPEA